MGGRFRENSRLTAFALGEMGKREAETFDREIGDHPHANEAIEEILEVSSLLQNELASEPGLFLTTEQREAVLSGDLSASRYLNEEGEPELAVADGPRDGRTAADVRGGTSAPPLHRRPLAVARMVFGGTTAAAAALVLLAIFSAGLESEESNLGSVVVREGADPGGYQVAVQGEESLEDVVRRAVGPSDVRVVSDIPGFDLFTEIADGQRAVGTSSRSAQDVAATELDRAGEPFLGLMDNAIRMAGIGDGLAVSGARNVMTPVSISAADRTLRSAFTSKFGGYAGPVRRGGPQVGVPVDELMLVPPSGIPAVETGRDAVLAEGFFLSPFRDPVSVFPLTADRSAYVNLREFRTKYDTVPPPEMVSIGDLVNCFDYGYPSPSDGSDVPVRPTVEVGECPWSPEHMLVRIGLKAKPVLPPRRHRNAVVLVDVSPSMLVGRKLGLAMNELETYLRRLGLEGKIAVVPFDGAVKEAAMGGARVHQAADVYGVTYLLKSWLDDPPVRGATVRTIEEAVSLGRRSFGSEGVDDVLVFTDSLRPRLSGERPLAGYLKPFEGRVRGEIAVIGFGEHILAEREHVSFAADRYRFFHAGSAATLRRMFDTLGRGSVSKISVRGARVGVEFNPARVLGFRLLNSARVVDRPTQGEGRAFDLRSGEEFSALYEVIPTTGLAPVVAASGHGVLRYTQFARMFHENGSKGSKANELLSLVVNFQHLEEPKRTRKVETVVPDVVVPLEDTSDDFRFAASVAGFGMLVGGYEHLGAVDFPMILDLAEGAMGTDAMEERREFFRVVGSFRDLFEAPFHR